ncbi:MAG: hypothetical protein R3F61_24515 [Myxococcota bacterium]
MLLSLALAQSEPIRVRTSEDPPAEVPGPPSGHCPGAFVANGLAFGGLAVAGGSLVVATLGITQGDLGWSVLGSLGTASGAALTTVGAVGVGVSGGRCGLAPRNRWVAATGFLGTGMSMGFLAYSLPPAFQGVDFFPVVFLIGGSVALTASLVPVVQHQTRLHQLRLVPVVGTRGFNGLVVTGRF